MNKIFDNKELNDEHEALQRLASAICENWSKITEDGCSIDGLTYLYDEISADYKAFMILANKHKEEIKAYRKKEQK